MDFKFNVNRLLPRKINRITHTLIPEDFRPGDRREYNESQRQLSRIIDEMGEASAQAQGLSKPITSAAKLRDTDHIVYLLVDNAGNGGFGTVVGLLKTGSKNLFMFDEAGAHFQLQPRCVLDFYVHETKQRMGFGKDLYQYMLAEEQIKPVKLAIDRPSEKLLRFLRRHYGLDGIIPQNNKFVVFQGFFDDECQDVRGSRYTLPTRGSIDSSYNYNNNNNNNNNSKPPSATSNGHSNNHSAIPRSSYGRYAAARPPCSMANIIHNAPVFGQAAERTGEIPSTPGPKLERPRSLSLYSELEQNQRNNEISTVPTPAVESKPTPVTREISIETEPEPVPEPEPEFEPIEREPTPLERQPTPKAPESASKKSQPTPSKSSSRKNSLSVHSEEQKPPSSIKPSPSCAQEVAGNQNGHLDLKFYHSPLW